MVAEQSVYFASMESASQSVEEAESWRNKCLAYN